MTDAIVIVPANPDWPAMYDEARAETLRLLSVTPRLIEHIGSTAVPGLDAKPVIDIVVLVEDLAEIRPALPALEAVGYEFRPEASDNTKLFLRRYGADGTRTHHLHIRTDAIEVERHLVFRDCLPADAGLRATYAALKHDLARRHPDDRASYVNGKDAFVDAAVRAAGGPARR